MSIRLPRILITNDDGIDAPGLTLLHDIAAAMAEEVWVIAPDHDRSGTGQTITLTEPIRVQQRTERVFAVSGTPSDCVAMALGHLMRENRPNLLLSGVNAGRNVGDEINLSGTVGAALCGLMLGVPSIALSQECQSRDSINWEPARAHIPTLLQHFLAKGWRKDTCLSVNIPDIPPDMIRDFAYARAGTKNITRIEVEERTDKRENNYYWFSLGRTPENVGDEESDIAIMRKGQIAVTAVTLDRSLSLGRAAVSLRDIAAA